jgi:predicted DNA-binding transcriptional regulator AlpA
MEPLMSLPEVAAALQVSLATMYSWQGTDRGPKSGKIGTLIRYRAEDVREFVDSAFAKA